MINFEHPVDHHLRHNWSLFCKPINTPARELFSLHSYAFRNRDSSYSNYTSMTSYDDRKKKQVQTIARVQEPGFKNFRVGEARLTFRFGDEIIPVMILTVKLSWPSILRLLNGGIKSSVSQVESDHSRSTTFATAIWIRFRKCCFQCVDLKKRS